MSHIYSDRISASDAANTEGRVYLVCDSCGFFYGDVRLYPEQTVECPECGSEAAWAFPKLDKALAMQAQIKEAKVRV